MSRRRVIIGMPQARVGSNFLTRLLNSHEEIRMTSESRLYCMRRWPLHFTHTLSKITKYPGSRREASMLLRRVFKDVAAAHPRISNYTRTPELSAYCIREIEVLFGKDWDGFVGDKGYYSICPPSVRRFPTIEEALDIFPDMQVLFLHRHPLDMFTSLAIHHKRRIRAARAKGTMTQMDGLFQDPGWYLVWSTEFYRHSLGWIDAMERWERIKQSCSSLTLRYEDSRDDPEGFFWRITDFLGIGPPDRMHEKLRAIAAFNHIGYWKREYPGMKEYVDPKLFDVMERYGYSA